MADIHIGKISQSETGRGKAQLVYHIPVDTPKAGIVPTPQSSLTGLVRKDSLGEQTEIDALAAGTLVEITKDIVVEKSQTQAEVAAAVSPRDSSRRADWQNVKADYNSCYNFEHKFYGVTLSAST